MADLSEFARQLFDAYGRGDLDRMRAVLADHMVAHITNASGGTSVRTGRVTDLWMVEARLAYSDEFWSA